MKRLLPILLVLAFAVRAFAGIMLPDYHCQDGQCRACDPAVESCSGCDPEVQHCPGYEPPDNQSNAQSAYSSGVSWLVTQAVLSIP